MGQEFDVSSLRDATTNGHTSGDWYVAFENTRVRWPVVRVNDSSYEEGFHDIAEVSDHVSKNVSKTINPRWRKVSGADEAIANANLMAAAPDLFDALGGLLKFIGVEGSSDYAKVYGTGIDEETCRSMLIQIAEQAIAKARGESLTK